MRIFNIQDLYFCHKNVNICNRPYDTIESYMPTRNNNEKLILFHYPKEEWGGDYKDSTHLYGYVHAHNNDLELKKIKNRYNVSADVIGFTPKTLDEIIELNKKL